MAGTQMSSLHMEVDFEKAYARVRNVAGWMYLLAMFSFVPLGIAAVVLTILTLAAEVEAPIALSMSGVAVLCFLTVFGAQRMKRLESYRLSQLAAILTLTPLIGVCWFPFGLIVGIWALMVLQRRDVAAAFEVKKREMRSRRSQMRDEKRGRRST